jgi:hypothetical protein
MARSIKTIAQRIPAAPEEESNSTGGDTTAIDGIKIASYKNGKALSNDCLHTATGNT